MAYATIDDVRNRITKNMDTSELALCETLLEDAAVLIDSTGSTASDAAKLVVSCRMVIRAMVDGESGIPVGASQGSMSGLGYSQSWTIGNSGSVGELYLTKSDRKLLKLGDLIGSYSPVEGLVTSND